MESKENFKILLSIVGTLCLMVMIPLLSWSLNLQIELLKKLGDHNTRISVLEAWRGQGTRYTREDAVRDYAPVVEKVNDHELRIRGLEGKEKK